MHLGEKKTDTIFPHVELISLNMANKWQRMAQNGQDYNRPFQSHNASIADGNADSFTVIFFKLFYSQSFSSTALFNVW